MHEHLAAGQGERGDAERDAREQYEALRHHATTAATVLRSASSSGCFSIWRQNNNAETGIRIQVMIRRIRLMPSINSERVSWKRRASAASFRA